jgi:hypothetical protein
MSCRALQPKDDIAPINRRALRAEGGTVLMNRRALLSQAN